MLRSLILLLIVLFWVQSAVSKWELAYEFKGDASDNKGDRGADKISKFWDVDPNDLTNGFKDTYRKTKAGDETLFIDSDGYLVLQPTCPLRGGGQCIAIQCGELMINNQICECDNDTMVKKQFPYWCQLDWDSAKIISKKTFNIRQGGLFVFEDVWVPRGRPIWPAIWLLPVSNPVYGGKDTPIGGDYNIWPNNGEIDIMETISNDPRIYGTLHYSCGNEFNGWPGLDVTVNNRAKRGTAYQGGPIHGNILATRNRGDNPLPKDGHLGTLCFVWNIDPVKGPVFSWYTCDPNPFTADGSTFVFKEMIDVMVNREGTDSIGGISGDDSGTLSFSTTPFWPGSKTNSPPLTLYKGWSGSYSYGFQGYYPIQGNVRASKLGIHNGIIIEGNPDGLGIVPKFDENNKPINNTIDHLYEPLLCSMMGDWDNLRPLPWKTQACKNPPKGQNSTACPLTGKGNEDTYDFCWVDGADKPGVGWWSNSPLAKGVKFAPFDESQNWNIILNVAVGGDWPRGVGEEGKWGQNFDDVEKSNLKMKSIRYYELKK
jgi:hypothetical protein